MARRHVRFVIAGLVLGAVTGVAGCSASSAPVNSSAAPSSAVPSGAASPAPDVSSAAPTLDVALASAERLVTQEGLAIALASNVLQTHLILVSAASDATTACQRLDGGGSYNGRSRVVKGATTTIVNRIYFDTACHDLYMTQDGAVTERGDTGTQKATSSYLSPDGTKLGTMTTSSRATFSDRLTLEGTGTFTPEQGGVPVSLGLACASFGETGLDCQGGVAQDFPAVGASIASVTKLRLAVGSNRLTFVSTAGGTTATAALGALSIVSKDHANLSIAGAKADRSTLVTKGEAGGLVLFPPRPTGWTVTDAAGDVAFRIDVTSDKTRTLAGVVTRLSTKEKIATLAVDRSGTGTMTFAGEAPIAVNGWLLAG